MAAGRTISPLVSPAVELAQASTNEKQARHVCSFGKESALGPDDVKSRDDDDCVDPCNDVAQK